MINTKHTLAISGEVALEKNISIEGSLSTSTISLEGNVQIVTAIGKHIPEYIGPYIVVPKVYGQYLDTDNKKMTDDVLVKEITKHIFDNEKGLTVQIGEI